MRRTHNWVCYFSLSVLLTATAGATTVPGLTFEQLTDESDLVVAGQVTRSWSGWDSNHKYIWTHYELAVSRAVKGAPGSAVIVSEPGGIVGNQSMSVAGAPAYAVGEKVAIFLKKMPNGYFRTVGWGQGKYTVDQSAHLHGGGLLGAEFVRPNQLVPGTSLQTLENVTLDEFRARVSARMTAQGPGSAK
jgi:hypothetical protein